MAIPLITDMSCKIVLLVDCNISISINIDVDQRWQWLSSRLIDGEGRLSRLKLEDVNNYSHCLNHGGPAASTSVTMKELLFYTSYRMSLIG